MKLNISNMIKAGIDRRDLEAFLAKWSNLFSPAYLAAIAKKHKLEF